MTKKAPLSSYKERKMWRLNHSLCGIVMFWSFLDDTGTLFLQSLCLVAMMDTVLMVILRDGI